MTFLMMVSRVRLSEVLKDRASMRGLIQLPPMQVRRGARQPQLRLLCFPLYLHRRQLAHASHRRSVSQFLAQPPRKTVIENVMDLVILTMVWAASEAQFRQLTTIEKQMSMTFLLKVVMERLSEVLRNRISMRGLSQLPAMQVRRGAKQPP